MTTMFSEWQQMSQTKVFVNQLKQSIEEIKNEAIDSTDRLTLEQIAISTIERNATARTLEQIVDLITSKEEEENE